MTPAQLEEHLARWTPLAPITMEDLVAIKCALDEAKPIGIPSDVVLRGDRIEVTLGVGDAAVTRAIQVRTEE